MEPSEATLVCRLRGQGRSTRAVESMSMVGAYECIRTRRTVREFKPDLVPDAIVHNILRAGRWAPSSSNTQPWHFVVVRNRETIAAPGRIATQGAVIGQAPLAIAIVMENARRPLLDAGRATRHDDEYERKGTCGILLAFEPLRYPMLQN